MRSTIMLLLCLIFSIVSAEALLTVDFDANNSNYNILNGGIVSATDYFTRSYNSDPSITHYVLGGGEGTYYVIGKDIDAVSGSDISAEIVLSNVDVSAHTDLQVTFILSAPSGERYESIISGFGEDWIIGEYSLDGGNWTKFSQFTGQHAVDPAYMSEDTDLNGQGDGVILTDTFQEFTYSIPSCSTLRIRFLFITGSGTEEVAIDNIRISGTVPGPPDAPANLITVSVTSSEANISWDAVTGATVYHIYRSDNPYSGFAEVGTSGTTAYQDTDVSAGNKYFYYVTADNAK